MAPPFTVDLPKASAPDYIEPGPETLFPVTYRTNQGDLALVKSNEEDFLASELSVDRLNDIHGHLWLAGLPMPPRPLHYQIVLQREITICEKMDMHLTWGNGRIFIKPIPRFLLSRAFWETHLECSQGCGWAQKQKECTTKAQRSIALGFLFTYAALLSFESDFAIAKERGLLPSDLDISRWTKWQKFVEENITLSVYRDSHRRFHYGELRLGRLNAIYLFTRLSYYMNQWPNYSSFLRDQLGWLATTTIYIALVLTAMQVGLATDQLKANAPYMTAAYGFSVFAILGPLISGGAIVLALVILVAMNWKFQKRKSAERFKCSNDFENRNV